LDIHFVSRRVQPPITPAQIRAGRALIEWSQQKLADAAALSLSTVRDYENERRGGEVGGLRALQRALENEGVAFLPGDDRDGPGVRLNKRVVTVLRVPTRLVNEGLLIPAEWQGRQVHVFVSREVLEDLAEIPGDREPPSGTYAAAFTEHRTTILKAAANALEAGRITPDYRVYVTSADIPELN
jgi:transcriptional regulator with XRE-family HTH domain